jgi:hypothetical protein
MVNRSPVSGQPREVLGPFAAGVRRGKISASTRLLALFWSPIGFDRHHIDPLDPTGRPDDRGGNRKQTVQHVADLSYRIYFREGASTTYGVRVIEN